MAVFSPKRKSGVSGRLQRLRRPTKTRQWDTVLLRDGCVGGERFECDLSTLDSFSAGPAFKGEFSAKSRHFEVLRQRGGGSTKVSPCKILSNLLGLSYSHMSSGNKFLLAHSCFAISIFRGFGLNALTITGGFVMFGRTLNICGLEVVFKTTLAILRNTINTDLGGRSSNYTSELDSQPQSEIQTVAKYVFKKVDFGCLIQF